MNLFLLKIIVCPVCKKKLFYNKKNKELFCKFDSLIYPFYKGIPKLLKEKAKSIKK